MTRACKGDEENINYLLFPFYLGGRPVFLEDAIVYIQVTINQSGRDCSIHPVMFPSLTCIDGSYDEL